VLYEVISANLHSKKQDWQRRLIDQDYTEVLSNMLSGEDEKYEFSIHDLKDSSMLKDIYIALDEDAQKDALEIAENLLNLGKRVFLVDLQQKDPSEMGFQAFTRLIQSAVELDLSGLMLHKINAL